MISNKTAYHLVSSIGAGKDISVYQSKWNGDPDNYPIITAEGSLATGCLRYHHIASMPDEAKVLLLDELPKFINSNKTSLIS